jgi:hypothetical protein
MNEPRQLSGQIVRQRRVAQRPQRRELSLQAGRGQLEDPLRAAQVLQPVEAQISQRCARRQPVPYQHRRNSDTSTWPPQLTTAARAARCTSSPTSPAAVQAASPQ